MFEIPLLTNLLISFLTLFISLTELKKFRQNNDIGVILKYIV